MITQYGISVVRKALGADVLVVVLAFFFVGPGVVRTAIVGVAALTAILVLNFFRDPDRLPPAGDHTVLSPADGKVVLIREAYEPEYLAADALQVSIFMSPLNVHVNRFPISGTIGHFRHIPGEYLVAFDDKSSERNERTHIGVEGNGHKVLFKQIAGTVARRIVANLQIGQQAKRGERFGMIRFGSRVDVIMPKPVALRVALNDRVVAGETILADYAGAAGATKGDRA